MGNMALSKRSIVKLSLALGAGLAGLALQILLGAPDHVYAAAKVGQPATPSIADGAAQADTKQSIERMKSGYARPTSIPFPASNPYTPAKAELGKQLYYDPRLSASGSQSCSSCHNPALSWGDGLAKGIGFGQKQLGRRSPTVLNAAWGSIFFWDGRAGTLEQQALGPIQSPGEMNMPIDELIKHLQAIPGYQQAFEAAFPGEGLKPDTVARAIATFERTIVSPDAPFDQWIAGDEKAISQSAKNGFAIFNTKAACNACHSGWNFTDDSFYDIGLPSDDIGRGKFLPDTVRAQHAFKTPGLREIATRRPYMHDGSIATLEAVVEHYDQGGVARPSRSDLIKPLGLTAQEKADLVAFLRTLGAPQQVSASLPSLPD
jgi:cytochrome c peroxidase